MENLNHEENQPLELSKNPTEANQQEIEETRPWSTDPSGVSEIEDIESTAATPIHEATDQFVDQPAAGNELKGHEATILVPVEQADAAPDTTNPHGKLPSQKPPKTGLPNGRPLPWFFFPLIGLAILLVVLLVSGFGGYSAGIGQRKNAEKTQVAQALSEQYQLGLQDMEQGAYARALQRFEYVVKLDPSYPGVIEKLAEVMLEINTTATPTMLPTSTLTPTPDTRGSEQLFAQAEQALAGSDWDGVIDSLLALRKTDASFRAVEVDGLLFLALRNKGRDKILKEADLEGGMYDLTLASKFGPLDAEASGLLTWSELYITGASFWGIDWEQAVNYFSQVAPQLPNLMDGSKMTATERLRQALFEWGNQLASNGQYCKAVRAYQQSIEIGPDPIVQQAGELAAKGCEGGDQAAATPKPNKKPKVTPNP